MTHQLLSSALKKALVLPLEKESNYVFFSDQHKGNNSYADDFAHNMRIYKGALHHYYLNDYTYIELGDGIEFWENRHIEPILEAHKTIFGLLKDFHSKKRLYLLYGNHDMVFKNPKMVKKYLGSLFDDLQYYESVVLQKDSHKILLLHEHQADYMNYLFWRFHRFLVRYLWTPLQLLGIKDPTSPAKNYRGMVKVERRMKNWIVKKSKLPIIFGHTHRPRFPEPWEIPMFNTGSCVHPKSIIGIEIVNLQISLVKWRDDNSQNKVTKEIMAGPTNIDAYW